jgi:hypothetical protein
MVGTVTPAQTLWMQTRIDIHNTIAEAEARCRKTDPWCGLELLLKLDLIEVYALKMMWVS